MNGGIIEFLFPTRKRSRPKHNRRVIVTAPSTITSNIIINLLTIITTIFFSLSSIYLFLSFPALTLDTNPCLIKTPLLSNLNLSFQGNTKPYLTHVYFFFTSASGWLPTPPTSHSQIASPSLRGGKPVISSLGSFLSHAVHPSLRRTLGFSRLRFFPSVRLVASLFLLLCFRLSDSAFVLPKLHHTPLLDIIENKVRLFLVVDSRSTHICLHRLSLPNQTNQQTISTRNASIKSAPRAAQGNPTAGNIRRGGSGLVAISAFE